MDREEAIKVAYGIPVTKAQHEALQFLIPELAENEDERIRKYIINFVKSEKGVNLPPDDADRMLAYLEKQKEQRLLSIGATSEWLRNHVCNYVNSKYNEFHKCVEYDGSIDKERLINDFEEAMQKESLRDFIDDFPYSDEQKRAEARTYRKRDVERNEA